MANKPIGVPQDLTAFLQVLQRHAANGHVHWCGDEIVRDKLPGLIQKHPLLELRADDARRSYRKKIGRASVHLVVSPDLLKPDTERVRWLMLSTAGREGLASVEQPPAAVRDLRTAEGRLTLFEGRIELVHVEKTIRNGRKKPKTSTTWTWRFSPQRYRELEAEFIGYAKQRDFNRINEKFRRLAQMPLAAGIRSQILALHKETNRMLGKVKASPLPPLHLPMMRLHKFWDKAVTL